MAACFLLVFLFSVLVLGGRMCSRGDKLSCSSVFFIFHILCTKQFLKVLRGSSWECLNLDVPVVASNVSKHLCVEDCTAVKKLYRSHPW